METEKTIVEINGVKMEVDLRHARVIHDNIRVGTKVKLLAKGGYGGPRVYPGVVVGFEPFRDLPTIIVAYVVHEYAKCELNFAYINKDEKCVNAWDMVPSLDEELPINKAEVIAVFDRDISKKEAEIADINAKRAYFLKYFEQFFVNAETAKAPF